MNVHQRTAFFMGLLLKYQPSGCALARGGLYMCVVKTIGQPIARHHYFVFGAARGLYQLP